MARTGIRPSAPEALKAKCCECCASYGDGRYLDCQVRSCPLYYRMPYRKLEPDLSWVFGKWTRSHRNHRLALGLSEEEYIKQHIYGLRGKIKLGFPAVFRAKCYRCCNDFFDGRVDCNIRDCSLYYWMPYRKSTPKLDWIFDLPYTRKHNERRILENLSREEYIQRYIAKVIEDDDDTEDEPEEPRPIRKVRRLL